jgi:hypothetical protein
MNYLTAQVPPRTDSVNLAQAATIIGTSSALVVGVSALCSWCFARGLVLCLGFPASVATIRNSAELFPSMAFVHALTLVLGFGLTYSLSTRPTADINRILRGFLCAGIVLAMLATLVSTGTSSLPSVRKLIVLRICAVVGPFLLGFVIKSFGSSSPPGNVLLASTFALIVAFWVVYPFQVGFIVGEEIKTNMWKRFAGPGFSEIKRDDFPIVALRTKEPLNTLSNPDNDRDAYIYPGKGPGIIRMILHDESDYYFVEIMDGKSRSFSVRRDRVSEVTFLGDYKGLVIESPP